MDGKLVVRSYIAKIQRFWSKFFLGVGVVTSPHPTTTASLPFYSLHCSCFYHYSMPWSHEHTSLANRVKTFSLSWLSALIATNSFINWKLCWFQIIAFYHHSISLTKRYRRFRTGPVLFVMQNRKLCCQLNYRGPGYRGLERDNGNNNLY